MADAPEKPELDEPEEALEPDGIDAEPERTEPVEKSDSPRPTALRVCSPPSRGTCTRSRT